MNHIKTETKTLQKLREKIVRENKVTVSYTVDKEIAEEIKDIAKGGGTASSVANILLTWGLEELNKAEDLSKEEFGKPLKIIDKKEEDLKK